MNLKLQNRRENTIKLLTKQLSSPTKNTKEGEVPLDDKDKERMKKEVLTLIERIGGKKKEKKMVVNKEGELVKDAPKYYLDIMSISFSKVRRSDRRKNKGKSRKKMRTKKTSTLLKSVILQEGMLQAYREGRMGLSPKTHAFRIRKHEESTL